MFNFGGLADVSDDEEAWGEIQRNREQRQVRRRTPVSPAAAQPIFGMGDHMQFANQIAAPHFGAHNSMVAQVNDAIREENERRVAQAREMRRMEHERQMKKMEIDAILSRLQRAQQPASPARVPIASGRNFAIYGD